MPITKNQRIRCKILDDCFRNRGKKYQIEDLIQAVNEGMVEIYPDRTTISRRTIYNDIEFMQSPEGGNADIVKERDGRNVYYRYADANFSVFNSPFREEDRQYLRTMMDALSRLKGLPHLEALQEAFANIEMLAAGPEATPCIEFEANPYIEGVQHLQPLNNAIQSRSAVELVYQPYDKPSITYRFHPQYLKQCNHRWYVLGVTTQYPEDISTFPLDRIVSLKPIADTYIPASVDWDDYFDDVVGITLSDSPLEEVHFLVHGKTGHYIQTKPIHSSQRHHWIDTDTLDVHLTLRINYEFRRILLSYADAITILSPASLVASHRQQLLKALEQYQ